MNVKEQNFILLLVMDDQSPKIHTHTLSPNLSIIIISVCFMNLSPFLDMAEVERLVRTIEADGLLWGACK